MDVRLSPPVLYGGYEHLVKKMDPRRISLPHCAYKFVGTSTDGSLTETPDLASPNLKFSKSPSFASPANDDQLPKRGARRLCASRNRNDHLDMARHTPSRHSLAPHQSPSLDHMDRLHHHAHCERDDGRLDRPRTVSYTLYTDGVLWFLGMIVVRLWAGLTVRTRSLYPFKVLTLCLQVIVAPPTYWWMTVTTDVALTSIFVSRMVLHLRVVASPHGTLVNGGAAGSSRGRTTSRYSGEPVFTAATISTATKPASSTAAMGHHHNQHHHPHYRRSEVEVDRLVRDSMWTVQTREEWDEGGARDRGGRRPDEESWEMDVVRR
ncbi:3315_t:CDS:2 [Acaulospora colombiana]|uniref:3315_t:CDS:1 n=1 Tax=Acaulospora colombiana TaxID=27376 RepID=A0ACA9M6P8_9GLOM|nr:3315_t:CDS:2 [Acaulospora colombiana]